MVQQTFLRCVLLALLVVDSLEVPIKDSKSPRQHSSGSNAATNSAPYRKASLDRTAPVQYNTDKLMSQPMQFVMGSGLPQGVVQTAPASSDMSLAAPQELYSTGSVSYAVPVEYAAGSPQTGAVQSGLPESNWLVAPQSLEEASANAQAQGASDPASQALLPPAGPVLQSGETSNVVKEAELGNYQQETEEFGYPSQTAVPAPGFANLPMSSLWLPGYWGFPYPGFDYRLLYGLYPPGMYSTFSQSHEKGKDYNKDVHYLKEHDSVDYTQGSQQQKLFPSPPQYSTGHQAATRV